MIRKCPMFLALLFAWANSYAQSPAKPEFEAASIKPSPPPTGLGYRFEGSCRGWPLTADPGPFTCENISLRGLIGAAYGVVAPNQISAPDLAATRFDLRATVPPGATREQFPLIFQSLLEDRFKLKVHREMREMPRYELVIAKDGPKFKESVPVAAKDDDDKFSAGPPQLDKDGYPIVSPRGGTLIVNDKARMHDQMTMDTLASQVSSQLGAPVTNATDLTGKYDIDMHWVYWTFRTATASAPPPPGNEPTASAPTGPTLTRALEDQLGLRVESTKGPVVDFLVVDHAEKVPTEN